MKQLWIAIMLEASREADTPFHNATRKQYIQALQRDIDDFGLPVDFPADWKGLYRIY